jgi:peptidoglycan-associated lipoprotein
MRKNYWLVLALILILPAMVFPVSCAKKAVESEPAVTAAPPAQNEEPQQDMAAQEAAEKARMESERLAAQQAEQTAMAARNLFTNEDIYFEFDSSSILPAGQQVLKAKADYMTANTGVVATIEGHCDERGTDAYNMALGQRRADAARDYMVNLGISASRLNTISYGEERPVDTGHTEEAWAKNRRDHFTIN